MPGWIAGGARLAVRPHLPLDEPRFHAVAGEFGGGEQPGRASADDQDVVGPSPCCGITRNPGGRHSHGYYGLSAPVPAWVISLPTLTGAGSGSGVARVVSFVRP